MTWFEPRAEAQARQEAELDSSPLDPMRSGAQNLDIEEHDGFLVHCYDRADDDHDEVHCLHVTAPGFDEQIDAYVDHNSRRLCIDGDDPEANRAVEKWVRGRTEVRGRVLP